MDEEQGQKEYLGDGVYAKYDGYHIILTTEDGVSATNIVYLDTSVIVALERFILRLRKGQ